MMKNIANRRILIYHRSLNHNASGGEYLPLALISEFQKRDCRVTLALDGKSNISECAKNLGIDVDVSLLKVIYIKSENKILQKMDSIIPFYRTRIIKKLAEDVDLCISTFNPFDFGKPAHHFILTLGINDNDFYSYYTHQPAKTGLSFMLLKIKKILGKFILRPLLGVRSTRRMLSNPKEHFYPNSLYVEKTMREFFGEFNSTLFYPPTLFESHMDTIERHPLTILYLGLLQPHKRIEDIISIVERARELSGQNLSLLIAGRIEESQYVSTLKLAENEKTWLKLVGPRYGAEKEKFLLSGTYAIHATRIEAFGISVTEYLKAGLIPIVPDEGGTPEIVDSPELTYHTNEEAAHILTRLISDEVFRSAQLQHCAERAKIFTREAYLERQHKLLEEILQC